MGARMKKTLILIAILLPSLLFLTPFTPQYISYASDIPSWYLTPRGNDDFTLYAVGEGATLDEAKHVALKNISESLSVSIDSKTKKNELLNTSRNGSSYSKTIQNQISAKTDEINFRNYEVQRSEVVSGRFFILVALDKEAFINQQKTELSDLLSAWERVFQLALSKSIFEKWADLNSIEASRQKALNQVGIISSLDPTFDRTSAVERLNYYQNALRQLRNDLSVYLRIDTESQFLGPVIAKHLTAAGIKTAAEENQHDTNMAILSISSKIKRLKIYNNYIATVSTELSVFSNNGNLISNKIIEAKGSSAIDYERAVQSAGTKMDKTMMREGISMIIGIN